jgi:hypothetical protein
MCRGWGGPSARGQVVLDAASLGRVQKGWVTMNQVLPEPHQQAPDLKHKETGVHSGDHWGSILPGQAVGSSGFISLVLLPEVDT